MNTDTQPSHLSEPDIWPYVNQLEDLLDAVDFHLLRYLQERAEGNQGDAAQHFNIGHNMLGAAQTVADALAVKVRVRNETESARRRAPKPEPASLPAGTRDALHQALYALEGRWPGVHDAECQRDHQAIRAVREVLALMADPEPILPEKS